MQRQHNENALFMTKWQEDWPRGTRQRTLCLFSPRQSSDIDRHGMGPMGRVPPPFVVSYSPSGETFGSKIWPRDMRICGSAKIHYYVCAVHTYVRTDLRKASVKTQLFAVVLNTESQRIYSRCASIFYPTGLCKNVKNVTVTYASGNRPV